MNIQGGRPGLHNYRTAIRSGDYDLGKVHHPQTPNSPRAGVDVSRGPRGLLVVEKPAGGSCYPPLQRVNWPLRRLVVMSPCNGDMSLLAEENTPGPPSRQTGSRTTDWQEPLSGYQPKATGVSFVLCETVKARLVLSSWPSFCLSFLWAGG